MNSSQENPFDVIVIGGGITGAGVFREACLQGLKTLVLEKSDFGSGTSSASGKLIHGGFRYLRYGHLKIVFESCHERYLLFRKVAPHLVKPVRFIFPFYKSNKIPAPLMTIGLFLYWFLSVFRNLGNTHILKKSTTLSHVPQLNPKGLFGGISYVDGAAHDSRMVIETIKNGVRNKGVALSYTPVTKIEKLKTGFKVFVKTGDSEKIFLARTIVNATGAWSDETLNLLNHTFQFQLKKTSGVHLVFSQKDLPVTKTLAFEHPVDHRYLYLVPWGNRIIFGTTDTPCTDSPDHLKVDPKTIEYLMTALKHYFPETNLSSDKILKTFIGVRPLIGSNQNKNEEALSRDFEIYVDPDGLLAVTGGKLTTYRRMGQLTIKKLMNHFFKQKNFNPSLSKQCLFPRYETSKKILKAGADTPFEERYGYNPFDNATLHPLAENVPYFWEELEWICQHEFVQHLDDLVFRRTWLGLFYSQETRKITSTLAERIGAALGWSPEKIHLEKARLDKLLET